MANYRQYRLSITRLLAFGFLIQFIAHSSGLVENLVKETEIDSNGWESNYRLLDDDTFEITSTMDNGVAMGCLGSSKPHYDEFIELFLEDDTGRREAAGLEVQPAKYRGLGGEVEEIQVPLKWWPQECITRLAGFYDPTFTCHCPPGPPGKPGLPGIDGPRGPAGAHGEDGGEGLPGANGIPGRPGEHGAPGEKGHPGAVGPPGPPGDPGLPGNPGADGRPGRIGQKGQDGTPGMNGANGENGANGVDGSNGAKGPKGENGYPGRAGIPAPDGSPGIPGPPGSDGSNGINGDNGIPGPNGNPGVNAPCCSGWTSGSGWTSPPSSGWGWSSTDSGGGGGGGGGGDEGGGGGGGGGGERHSWFNKKSGTVENYTIVRASSWKNNQSQVRDAPKTASQDANVIGESNSVGGTARVDLDLDDQFSLIK